MIKDRCMVLLINEYTFMYAAQILKSNYGQVIIDTVVKVNRIYSLGVGFQ